jgi:hypothetical protein
MMYASDAGPTRGLLARTFKSNLLPDGSGLAGGDEPPRDVKKLVLVAGLGILSWVATYVGMLELIEANMGVLPLVHKLIIGFSVAMLMTMIIWLLDQMFAPIGAFTRLCYVAGYVFLSIISVGFGFGFYWKVLESRAESSRSAETAVGAVQGSLHAASTRLEQLDAVLVQLAQISREKAELERTKGTSCPNSKPGDGPRRKMRDEDANRFSFASEFVKGRVGAVKGEITALDADLAKIAADDPSLIDPKSGTRNEFMKSLSRKLDMTVTGFNAFRTDPQLKELRSELQARADKTTFGDPKNGGFLCPDVQLSQALHGAVRAIDQIPELEKPVIAAVEGSEATIEAFRRLTTTFYGLLSLKLPPSADELRELQKKAIQSVEGGAHPDLAAEGGLSKRDYVPLAIAVFVDLCLFLVSMGRPAGRLNGLLPKMREAERGPVIEILSRFNDIHRDRQIRENFELFRHVVFDVHGAYFVAVPLDAPPRLNPREREELRLEAQLLANFFTSFEKDQIFKRTWTPFSGTIRRKLRQQGSKFAESEAFRVYRFRDGAWAEIILGAVMGAARRAEAEAARRHIEEGLARTSDAALAPGEYAPLPFPSTAPRARRADTRPATSRSREADEPRTHAVSPEISGSLPEGTEIETKFKTGFGAYARGAQTELSPRPVREPDIGEPANSNTGPAARAATTRPSVAARQPDGENGAPAAQATRAAETVDVVLKRETATVSLPASSAASDGLIGRLGQALETIDAAATEPPNSGATVTLVATPAPLEIAGPSDAGGPIAEGAGADLDTDPSTADAADIADRLRPAIARG